MLRKLLPALVVLAALGVAATGASGADDPAPPTPPAAGEAPDDGQPYPPDGVTDPNAQYPTDGAGETTDPGEAGAVPPDASSGDSAPPPENAPPN
jgi:hypothetical protein